MSFNLETYKLLKINGENAVYSNFKSWPANVRKLFLNYHANSCVMSHAIVKATLFDKCLFFSIVFSLMQGFKHVERKGKSHFQFSTCPQNRKIT